VKSVIRNNKNYICAICAWIAMYVIDILYAVKNYYYLINSDTASEMILGNELAKNGGLLSKAWYYSTELRVLNTQIFYKIAFLISPSNWKNAKIIAMAMLLLVLSLSGIFFVRMIKGERSVQEILFALILVCPIGQWYAWNVLLNLYYVPHISITLVSIGLFIAALRHERARKIIDYILLALLAMFAAMGGLRQLMICYVPMGLALCLLVYDMYKEGGMASIRAKILDIAGLLVSLGFSLVGYKVNRVFANIYSFEELSENKWQDFSLHELVTSLGQFLGLFGWRKDVKILSISGVLNGVALVLVCVIIYFVVKAIREYKSDSIYGKYYLYFGVASFALQLILYSQCNRANETYWIPLIPIVIFLAMSKIDEIKLMIGFVALIVLCSVSTLMPPTPAMIPTNEKELAVSTWLVDNSYENGYATFWNSNAVTQLTNGRVQMWTVTGLDSLDVERWLQLTSHSSEAPEENAFILMSTEELEENKALFDGAHVLYEDDNYIVVTAD